MDIASSTSSTPLLAGIPSITTRQATLRRKSEITLPTPLAAEQQIPANVTTEYTSPNTSPTRPHSTAPSTPRFSPVSKEGTMPSLFLDNTLQNVDRRIETPLDKTIRDTRYNNDYTPQNVDSRQETPLDKTIRDTRYDNEYALDQNIDNTKHDDKDRGKNWDSGNTKTLNEWIQYCNKQHYIYDYAIDMIMRKSKIVKIMSLILSALQSFVTVSNISVSDQVSPYLSWTFKIVTSIIAGLMFICNQYTVIVKIDDIIKSYTSYAETINNFLSIIVSTHDMKKELRPDGNKFILQNNSIYINICKTAPHIDQRYWIDGMKQYNNYCANVDTENGNYLLNKSRIYRLSKST